MIALPRLALVLLAALAPAFAHAAETGTVHAARLAQGEIAPFQVERCCGNTGEFAPAPLATADAQQALRLHWAQANYRGNRETRGVEVLGPRATQPELWFGFRLLVPSSFPADKQVIVGQLICWEKTAPTNKTLSFSLHQNRLGVTAYYSDRTGSKNPTRPGEAVAKAELSTDFPRDRWVDFVVHARVSNTGAGFLRVWFDGAPEDRPSYEAHDINLGVTHFDGPDRARFGPYPKAGMYCWDAPNYSPGETREVWLGSLAFIDGAHPEGHRLVSPATLATP